jgi:hypothetical protein
MVSSVLYDCFFTADLDPDFLLCAVTALHIIIVANKKLKALKNILFMTQKYSFIFLTPKFCLSSRLLFFNK